MKCQKCEIDLRNSTYGSFCEDCYTERLTGYKAVSGKFSKSAQKLYDTTIEETLATRTIRRRKSKNE